ncbi:hypothetical protein [Legionella longbeachae]|uniref:Putative coiled-coil protein n=1 Tax=Legionella longbeachae serogroup 1 (strain NSW150) TaxID=661367 RepID=D3HT76_LEGLN|nr:hypothetical protein [Legionella longbeachae]VEE02610.1 coiled-coil protein [Legionella oakridgensis]HBD7397872.1 hypothetical protein [Legionella pneumophila]ARB91124.1 hypothetical protein A6J40_02505 [Legionella longbeachae]EEZ94741.1 conserved hypothetical protein [Legionella longbeachae D-4968]QIN32446.1 hypothetical protein GCB94_09960 [Legionella longbeachae]
MHSEDEDTLTTNPENFENTSSPKLPDGNYTSRTTKREPNNTNIFDGKTVNNFELLRSYAENILKNFLKERMGELELTDLEAKIQELEKSIEIEKEPSNKNTLEANLNLLKDLNKVTGLSTIMIPNEDGTPSQYCILRDTTGGVTEKHSLIKMDDTITQLLNLKSDQEIDASSYLANRNKYKLNTQGILKLPKHGKTTEVQREAIALNISRILGFTTTESTMVEHNGKAALFIPFDKILLLNEFAEGEAQRVILPSSLKGITKIGDEYLHYSTIVPVGNRLNPEQTIKDSGHAMAFSYLCNDTDFIGMNNQNKAINDKNELYIFDQVVMSKEKMSFDTRLNLVPIGLGRHSRHNQGRNRSIIEDSSFDTKFDGVSRLLLSKNDIDSMLDNFLQSHSQKISQIKNSINAITAITSMSNAYFSKDNPELIRLKNQLKEVEILKNDALAVKKTINQRMKNLFANFPTLDGKAMNAELFLRHNRILKDCLSLEKLVNKPVLFTDDGRPYRHPWTYRNTNKISSINILDEKVRIKFTSLDPILLNDILKSTGVPQDSYELKDSLIIPIAELNKINENCIFPERSPFEMQTDYLDSSSLKRNLSGYRDEKQKMLISRIMDYQTQISKKDNGTKDVVRFMDSMLRDLNTFSQFANKGMVKQVELDPQLDMQQKLRKIIYDTNPQLIEKLQSAFEASVKLDRLNEFNDVLKSYVYCHCKSKELFEQYLDKCIEHGDHAINYKQAKSEADTMYQESVSVSHDFRKQHELGKISTVTTMRENTIYTNLLVDSPSEDWDNVDVPHIRESNKIDEAIIFKNSKERFQNVTHTRTLKVEPEVEPTALVVKP